MGANPLIFLIKFLISFISPLPIRTDRLLRQIPYVTYALLFLNVLVFLSTSNLSSADLMASHHTWGFDINHPSMLTLLTHAFVHDDIMHLAGNMLVLWLVGTVLEAGIGSVLFLLLYLASMVMSVILHGTITRLSLPPGAESYMIGASGAISGVTGYASLRYFRTKVMIIPMLLFLPIPIPIWLPMWFYGVYFGGKELISAILDFAGGTDTVAHWAHLGGLLIGLLAALLLKSAKEGQREFALEDTSKAANGTASKAQSLQDVARLLQERPDDPELLEAMAGLLMMQGEKEKSRDLYLRAIPRFQALEMHDRAAISYLNVLRVFPDNVLEPREQMSVAATLGKLGHHKEAIHAYELVVSQYGNKDVAENALLRAANIYALNLQDNESAKQLLRVLLTDYPQSNFASIAQMRLRELK